MFPFRAHMVRYAPEMVRYAPEMVRYALRLKCSPLEPTWCGTPLKWCGTPRNGAVRCRNGAVRPKAQMFPFRAHMVRYAPEMVRYAPEMARYAPEMVRHALKLKCSGLMDFSSCNSNSISELEGGEANRDMEDLAHISHMIALCRVFHSAGRPTQSSLPGGLVRGRLSSAMSAATWSSRRSMRSIR